MSKYVDGFAIPIPEANLERYREMAGIAGAVWREHGALDYWECVGDDFSVEGPVPFPAAVGAKEGETVVFSWIVYASREERDRVNAAVMSDPRMAELMEGGPQPFECGRMVYGGFRAFVHR